MKLATKELRHDDGLGTVFVHSEAHKADTAAQRRAIAAHRRARARMLSNLAEFGVFGDATREAEWAEREVAKAFGVEWAEWTDRFCRTETHVDTRGNGPRVVFRLWQTIFAAEATA